MRTTRTVVGLVVLASALSLGCSNSESAAREDKGTIEQSGGPDALGVPEKRPRAAVPLPKRAGPRQETSGSVPHVQIGIEPDEDVVDALLKRAFALPGIENRATVVSLAGARGMWLADDIEVVHPKAIVRGREFAHIHPDGSLHVPLPFDRAVEVAEAGWGERHPWADKRDGWEGLVMLYTPLSMEELDVTFQLIVESYNHVTGQRLKAADFHTAD